MLEPNGRYKLLMANNNNEDSYCRQAQRRSSSPELHFKKSFFSLSSSVITAAAGWICRAICKLINLLNSFSCSLSLPSSIAFVLAFGLLLFYYLFLANNHLPSMMVSMSSEKMLESVQQGNEDEKMEVDENAERMLRTSGPSSSQKQYFRKRMVHLDLKGAPPSVDFLFRQLIPLFVRLNFTAVLVEFEDMFPYEGQLAKLARKGAYSREIVEKLDKALSALGIELIPLVQTFGHMEFVLKHPEFAELRESQLATNTICPSDGRTIPLIRQIIGQIRALLPGVRSLHVGADEAWHLAEDFRCQQRLNTTLHGSVDRLKLEHISAVSKMARDEFGFDTVYAWNDMFDRVPVSLLLEYQLGNLLVPIVWGYNRNVTTPDYFPSGLIHRISEVFDEVLFASAFKGANGVGQQFTDIQRYMDNLWSYKSFQLMNMKDLEGRLSGIVLTGWQRFAHDLPLCELLPIGLPVLIKQVHFLAHWEDEEMLAGGKDEKIHGDLISLLNCANEKPVGENWLQNITFKGHQYPWPLEASIGVHCHQFPGAELYKEMENVRILHWKWSLSTNNKKETEVMEKEYREQIREKLGHLLTNYYDNETVSEWLNQHPDLAAFSRQDHV